MCSGTQHFLALYGSPWFITDLTVAKPLGLILIQINPFNTDRQTEYGAIDQRIKGSTTAQILQFTVKHFALVTEVLETTYPVF